MQVQNATMWGIRCEQRSPKKKIWFYARPGIWILGGRGGHDLHPPLFPYKKDAIEYIKNHLRPVRGSKRYKPVRVQIGIKIT